MKNIDNNAQTPAMSSKKESNARLVTEIRELRKEIADSTIFSEREKDALGSYLASLRDHDSVAEFANNIRGSANKDNPAAAAKAFAERIRDYLDTQINTVIIKDSEFGPPPKIPVPMNSQPKSKAKEETEATEAEANIQHGLQTHFQAIGTCQSIDLTEADIAQSAGANPNNITLPTPRQYH